MYEQADGCISWPRSDIIELCPRRPLCPRWSLGVVRGSYERSQRVDLAALGDLDVGVCEDELANGAVVCEACFTPKQCHVSLQPKQCYAAPSFHVGAHPDNNSGGSCTFLKLPRLAQEARSPRAVRDCFAAKALGMHQGTHAARLRQGGRAMTLRKDSDRACQRRW